MQVMIISSAVYQLCIGISLLDIHVDCVSHTTSSHQAAITMTKAQYHNCSPYHNYFKIKSRFIASRCGYTAIAL